MKIRGDIFWLAISFKNNGLKWQIWANKGIPIIKVCRSQEVKDICCFPTRIGRDLKDLLHFAFPNEKPEKKKECGTYWDRKPFEDLSTCNSIYSQLPLSCGVFRYIHWYQWVYSFQLPYITHYTPNYPQYLGYLGILKDIKLLCQQAK
jgi:hypothetical protein